MNPSLKKAIRYLLAAYFITTLFGALLSILLGYALGLPSYLEADVKPSQSPAYKVTEPFHRCCPDGVFVLCPSSSARRGKRKSAKRSNSPQHSWVAWLHRDRFRFLRADSASVCVYVRGVLYRLSAVDYDHLFGGFYQPAAGNVHINKECGENHQSVGGLNGICTIIFRKRME